MFKLIKLLTVIMVSYALFGCYNKGELKTNIQNEYDRARAITKTKGDFCLYIGSVKFPYIAQPILPDDTQWRIWNKEDLSKTLPLFTEIGLLKREPVEGHPDLYRYDLTELGREYQHAYPKGTIYNNAFCYGVKKLIEVTDVTEKETGGGSGNATVKRIKVYVKFSYRVLEIPEWATKAKSQLDAIYTQMQVPNSEDIYPGSVTLIKKSDGSLYDEGTIGYIVVTP